ncbi:MAG: site-specific integrase [Thermoplasmata archaeon]
MVRVPGKAGRGAKYRRLLDDPSLERWQRNVARGSQITADVYLRRLGHVCATRSTSPSALLALGSKERRDFAADLVSDMEEAGRAGSYVLSTLRAVKSWLAFNGVALEHPIKVRGAQSTPTLEKERVPTQDELRRILLAASPRERCAAVLMSHAGLRPETLGNYRGTDGLRLGDLPDVRIKGKTVIFDKLPAQVVVRPELSKSGRRYFTFLGPEAADYVKAYLEERMRDGERLNEESDIIAPAWSTKAFLTSINVSDAVRKAIRAAGFAWRPYVLRAYFDTQLLLAESKGKTTHAYRQFFMGHVGDIEARYTTNKSRLPPDLVEDMRDSYRRSLPFLETTKPADREAELKASFRRQMLLVSGLSEKDIGKMDLEGMSDADLQRIVRERLVGAPDGKGNDSPNSSRQTVVPLSAVETYLEQGWEWVAQLPDARAVLRHGG